MRHLKRDPRIGINCRCVRAITRLLCTANQPSSIESTLCSSAADHSSPCALSAPANRSEHTCFTVFDSVSAFEHRTGSRLTSLSVAVDSHAGVVYSLQRSQFAVPSVTAPAAANQSVLAAAPVITVTSVIPALIRYGWCIELTVSIRTSHGDSTTIDCATAWIDPHTTAIGSGCQYSRPSRLRSKHFSTAEFASTIDWYYQHRITHHACRQLCKWWCDRVGWKRCVGCTDSATAIEWPALAAAGPGFTRPYPIATTGSRSVPVIAFTDSNRSSKLFAQRSKSFRSLTAHTRSRLTSRITDQRIACVVALELTATAIAAVCECVGARQ